MANTVSAVYRDRNRAGNRLADASAKRAALYCRVSTVKQEERGSSLDTQEASCRKHAAGQGYVIDEELVYRETYSGAELWDRPRLSELRAQIRHRDIDVVVVHDIDRLSRDPVHLGVILSEAEHAGVGVEFVLTPLDNSPEGQLIQYIRGYAAKIEREKIKERSLRGKKARLDAGKLHSHAGELYGYTRDRERGVRLINEPEAAVVRRIFHEVAVEGRSIRSLTDALNAEGVPAPSERKRVFTAEGRKNARWGKTSLSRILKHEAYKGETIVWKLRGDRSPRPEDEWVHLPVGVTPPIVSEEIWNLAQDRHSEGQIRSTINASVSAKRNESRPSLLRGLVRCAVCGEPMYTEWEKGKLVVYRCSSRGKAAGNCGAKRVNGDRLETWVWEQVSGILTDPDRIADAVAWMREHDGTESLLSERESTAKIVAKLAAEQERYARRIGQTDDDMIFAALSKELKRVGAERDALAVRLAQIDRQIEQETAEVDRIVSLQDYVGRVRANLSDLSFERKRDATVALVEQVVAEGADPSRWRVECAVPILTPGVLDTTSCSPARPAPARPCWPAPCQPSCRR